MNPAHSSSQHLPENDTAHALTRLLRVEKGHAEPEEVAALTAILLARASGAAAAPAPSRRGRDTAGWRRLERTPGFRAPHSWQG